MNVKQNSIAQEQNLHHKTTLASYWLIWSQHFETMTWLNVMEYLCQKWPRICSICLTVLWSFMTYHEFTPGFIGVRVTRTLDLCVCFIDRCLSFCIISFDHFVVCTSSICGFWLTFGIFKLFIFSPWLSKYYTISTGFKIVGIVISCFPW